MPPIREKAVLPCGHLLGHVEKQSAVTFFNTPQQAPKTPQITRFFAGGTPRDIVRALPLGKVRQLGWFFTIVEELVERHFHRSRQLFKGFDGWHGVTILNARDVAAKKTRTLLDVTLGELFCFTK